ncbi:MAG TPA: hypothetical protein VFZ97_13680 [Acidimicrobiales bacterium]
MGSVKSSFRTARDRALGGLIREIADDAAERSVQQISDRIGNVERILGDQGDAADEVAETIGRTLTRLSAEVNSLAQEVVRLRERLDRAGSPT